MQAISDARKSNQSKYLLHRSTQSLPALRAFAIKIPADMVDLK